MKDIAFNSYLFPIYDTIIHFSGLFNQRVKYESEFIKLSFNKMIN
jgi:hypothetical protein